MRFSVSGRTILACRAPECPDGAPSQRLIGAAQDLKPPDLVAKLLPRRGPPIAPRDGRLLFPQYCVATGATATVTSLELCLEARSAGATFSLFS